MSGMPGMHSPTARKIYNLAWWFERRASKRYWAKRHG
jgi:hypothetical protein